MSFALRGEKRTTSSTLPAWERVKLFLDRLAEAILPGLSLSTIVRIAVRGLPRTTP